MALAGLSKQKRVVPAPPRLAKSKDRHAQFVAGSGFGFIGSAPRLGAAPSAHPPGILAKLEIGAPNDLFEQEADRVADQVMRMPEPSIQRACCASCARGGNGETVRRNLESAAPGTAMPGGVTHQVRGLTSGGETLSPPLRAFFEPRFGYDLSQVRLHAGHQAAEMAKSIQAKAFTLGQDIIFGPSEYAPGSYTGQHLIAHELAHVIQQEKSGRRIQLQPDDSPPTALGDEDDETSPEGKEAHEQIQGFFSPSLWAEVEVPRAAKALRGVEKPTAKASPGYIDLWRFDGWNGYVGEIKRCNGRECLAGRDSAVQDARHYVRRLEQMKNRFLSSNVGRNEEIYTDSDVVFDQFYLGGGLQLKYDLDFKLLNSVVPQAIRAIPGRSRVGTNAGKVLHCRRFEDGSIIYWHSMHLSPNATPESKAAFDKQEEYEASPAGQAEAAARFVGTCVLHAIAGEFIGNPGFCGIVLDTSLGLIPYIDQAFDVRDLVAHCYWILFEGEYSSPLRWLSLALTLIGLIPEGGTVIEGVGSLARTALREGPEAVEGLLLNAIRKGIASEGAQKMTATFHEAWPILKRQGVERFIHELNRLHDAIDWLYQQIATANRLGAGALYELFGGNNTDLNKLMDEIDVLKALLKKLEKDSPELLENGFDLGYELFEQVILAEAA